MPNDNQLGNLPLGADPRLAQLSALIPQPPAQPASAGVLPPNLDQIIAQQSQLGMGAFGERERASMETAQRIQQLEQQMPGMARETVIQPRFGPQRMTTDIHGQTVDREVPGTGGFLHNLGQALLAVGLATTPGQAIEGVLKAGPRAEMGARTQELERLREEQRITQEPLGAAAGMAYHPITAGAAVTSAEARAQQVANRHMENLQKIAQGWAKLPYEQQKLQAEAWYKQAFIEAYQARTQAGITEAEIRAGAQKDIANAIQQSGMMREYPWLSMLVPGLVPAAPQVPSGEKPVGAKVPPKVPPAAKPKAGGGPPAGATHIGTSSKDGKDHYLDAQGRDLGPVR